ncbi:hypothetical protein GH714_002528 [Hevea brasiliensis]|uniref:Uncharacterized protein n=1 Tax=Hevea brasiliensis TaxID=3981 RepID=A0A6A6N248_HEVBR|nr:hypothetical protein GH714_002528 [Hevea brasiliensis]
MVKDMGKDFSHSLIRSCLELSITKKAKSTVTPSWVKIHMPLSSAKANTPPRDLLALSGICFQSAFRLSELSMFESPLARLDLSFLSSSVVTSPSSDLVPDPAGVHKAQQKLCHLLTLSLDRLSFDELAHVDSLIVFFFFFQIPLC